MKIIINSDVPTFRVILFSPLIYLRRLFPSTNQLKSPEVLLLYRWKLYLYLKHHKNQMRIIINSQRMIFDVVFFCLLIYLWKVLSLPLKWRVLNIHFFLFLYEWNWLVFSCIYTYIFVRSKWELHPIHEEPYWVSLLSPLTKKRDHKT